MSTIQSGISDTPTLGRGLPPAASEVTPDTAAANQRDELWQPSTQDLLPQTQVTNSGFNGTQRAAHPQIPAPQSPYASWRAAAAGLSRIRIQPGAQSGQPQVRDTRITVAQILDLLSDHGTISAVSAEFPEVLESDDIREALVFASRLSRMPAESERLTQR